MTSRSAARPLVLCLALWCLTGCATYTDPVSAPLNSDGIMQRYGSYDVEVLMQTEAVRIANLYSGTDDSRTCRTYAVTRYNLPVAPTLLTTHEAIVAGRSIGATLRGDGWTITKKGLHVGQVDAATLPADVSQLMRTKTTQLAIYVYELNATKNAQPITYATIAEIYHPDYLTLKDLGRRYPETGRDAKVLETTRDVLRRSLPD